MESSQKAWEFLQQHRMVAFATISAENNIPDLALIYYITDVPGKLYVATERSSKKIANITANPHVALVIGEEVEPKTLQLQGQAQVVSDVGKEQEFVERYARVANDNQSQSIPPLLHLTENSHMVFIEITISSYKYSDFTNGNNSIITGTPQDWITE